MKKTRRNKFNDRRYNTQSISSHHLISHDYLVLVGIFFHFWGYIDLYVDEQSGVNFEKKLENLPKLNNLLKESNQKIGLNNSILNIRKLLAHNPMEIKSTINIGCMQFMTGWTNSASKQMKAKIGPKTTQMISYNPNIDEQQLILAIYKMTKIIIDQKIKSEINSTIYTFIRSKIYLNSLAKTYIKNTIEKANEVATYFDKMYLRCTPKPCEHISVT